jgi:hypothetical protein
MTTDPSWLYSTIAQSSAAIVAIIGGFITAAILRTTAEKRSLIKERDSLSSYMRSSMAPLTENFAELQRKLFLLNARLEAIALPRNLLWGLIVLGYLALMDIFLPVLIIANEAFFDWTKTLVLCSFGVGLLAIFFYIAYQIIILVRSQ